MTVHRRDANDVAAELYARGFTTTRQEATALVAHKPDVVATLLGIPIDWGEMRHPGDRAAASEWGPADTGETA